MHGQVTLNIDKTQHCYLHFSETSHYITSRGGMGGSKDLFFRDHIIFSENGGGRGQPSTILRVSTENNLPINCQ